MKMNTAGLSAFSPSAGVEFLRTFLCVILLTGSGSASVNTPELSFIYIFKVTIYFWYCCCSRVVVVVEVETCRSLAVPSKCSARSPKRATFSSLHLELEVRFQFLF